MGRKDKKRVTKKDAAGDKFDRQKTISKIYDALETGSHKSGLKLINTALSKYGEMGIVMVLKAIILERMNKKEEALVVAMKVLDSKPTDTTVLHTLQIAFKTLNKLNEAVVAYENAVKQEPKNEELLVALFNAYNRVYAWNKQQQCAMQLYTKFKERRYLFWSGINMLLQHQHKPAGENKMLQLAEMMITRGLEKGAPMTTNELLICVRLKRRQGLYRQAVDLLHSPLAEEFKKDDVEHRRLLAEVMLECGGEVMRTQACAVYESLLNGPNSNADDWFFLKAYVKLRLHAIGDGFTGTTNENPPYIATLDFIHALQEKEKENPHPRRGPFLVEIDFVSHLIHAHDDNDVDYDGTIATKLGSREKVLHLLHRYFVLFGSKACFFADVQLYLGKLTDEEGQCLISDIVFEMKNHGEGRASDKEKANEWRQKVALQQVTQYFLKGDERKRVLLTVRAKMLFSMYRESRRLLGPGVGEELLQLCVCTLIMLYDDTLERTALLDAIIMLEEALKNDNKHNFQWSLLLVRLYCHPAIAAFPRALVLYGRLGIKHIQHDSMSHLIISDAIRYGYFEVATTLCEEVLGLHHDQHHQIPDFFKLAYKHGNFDKAFEFADLKQRLDHSVQRQICELESASLGLWRLADLTASSLSPLRARLDSTDRHGGSMSHPTDVLLGMPHPTLDNDDERLRRSLAALVANSDYGVVLSYSKPEQDLSTRLNRPALSLHSSWDVRLSEVLVKQAGCELHAVGRATTACLTVKSTLLRLLVDIGATNNAHDASKRLHLQRLREHLEILELLPNEQKEDEEEEEEVEKEINVFLNLDELTWSLAYHGIEVTLCMAECVKATRSWLDHINANANAGTKAKESSKTKAKEGEHGDAEANRVMDRRLGLKDCTARWASVNRSLVVVSALLLRARELVLMRVAAGSCDYLSDICSFLRHGADSLSLLGTTWATCVPTRKTFKRKKGKNMDNAVREMEEQALNVFATTRASARAVCDTLHKVLSDVRFELNKTCLGSHWERLEDKGGDKEEVVKEEEEKGHALHDSIFFKNDDEVMWVVDGVLDGVGSTTAKLMQLATNTMAKCNGIKW